MDPSETLRLAREALDKHFMYDTTIQLQAYVGWRDAGGFQPDVDGIPGDLVALRIAMSVLEER